MRTLTEGQRVILALTKTISGSLSLVASIILVRKIYLRYKEQSNRSDCRSSLRSSSNVSINTYYRMMFGASVLDIMYSFWCALSVLPAPTSTGGVFAHGTVGTCATQGFFVQLATPIMLYMAMLNTYFMLKIRYNIPDFEIVKRYEFWFHAIPISFWLITGFLGLSLKIFNAISLPELGCWLGSYPLGCVYTNTCTRGYKFAEYHDWYTWSFAYFWLFLCVVIVLVNSILIYTAIRKQEKRNGRYLAVKLQSEGSSNQTSPSNISLSLPEFNFDDGLSEEVDTVPTTDDEFVPNEEIKTDSCNASTDFTEQAPTINVTGIPKDSEKDAPNRSQHLTEQALIPNRTPMNRNSDKTRRNIMRDNARKLKQSRIAAVQSSLYLSSALFTAVWIFLPWLGSKLLVESRVRFFFAFMVNIASPSQGVFNLFIFVRLQYLRLRETKKDWSRLQCVKHCLFSYE